MGPPGPVRPLVWFAAGVNWLGGALWFLMFRGLYVWFDPPPIVDGFKIQVWRVSI